MLEFGQGDVAVLVIVFEKEFGKQFFKIFNITSIGGGNRTGSLYSVSCKKEIGRKRGQEVRLVWWEGWFLLE